MRYQHLTFTGRQSTLPPLRCGSHQAALRPDGTLQLRSGPSATTGRPLAARLVPDKPARWSLLGRMGLLFLNSSSFILFSFWALLFLMRSPAASVRGPSPPPNFPPGSDEKLDFLNTRPFWGNSFPMFEVLPFSEALKRNLPGTACLRNPISQTDNIQTKFRNPTFYRTGH